VKEKTRSFEDIRFEREQLGFEEAELLRKRGWYPTSSTPGSFWLWKREIEGHGVCLVNQSTAIAIQNHLDEVAEYARIAEEEK
jgi:hypothetical protein